MENVTVQSRVTPQLKEKSEEILNAMGLKTSEAIRIFLQQIVNSNGFPFTPSLGSSQNQDVKEIKNEVIQDNEISQDLSMKFNRC